jgi:polysaccharide biosynthesis protein PslG
MGRRTPLALTLLMVVVVALPGTASASAARKHTRPDRAHRCPAAAPHRRHRPRWPKCAVRRAAKHLTHRHGSKQANSPSVTTGPLVVGLNANVANWGGASTADRLRAITRATRAKWLREEIDWATVEPQPGVFDFSRYDHFMQLAAQRGLHVIAVLYDTPAWAGPAYNAIPSDPTAFAQYVAAVVGRFGTSGTFWAANPWLKPSAITTWELWNEAYLDTGDDGVYDPANYAQLVKAASTAGHAADPSARFLIGADMQSERDANGNWQWWVDALYQAVPDLNSYFDGVAMHDYGTDMTTLNPMIPGRPYDNYGHVMRIENLRRQFVNHGAAVKPFWITEAGWSTCTDSPTCVTPDQQATNLSLLFDEIHHDWSSYVQGVFIYSYGDIADPTSTQGGYGLTYMNGAPKPALSVFRAQAAASAG